MVFHATYLSFMERARTELLNLAGVDLARMAEERGVQIMVSEMTVKYHQAARLNDLVSVSAEVVKIGRASIVFRQRIERAGELLVEADVTLAVVDRARMKPARMPIEIEQALQ